MAIELRVIFMVLIADLPKPIEAVDPEERRIISGVSWEQYEAVLSELGDRPLFRVTYLDGVIEFLASSRRHERNKSTIGSLLEAYFQETRTEYFPLGSTTFRKEEKQAGSEPDESDCVRTEKEFPDLAIEVVVSSGGVEKLEVYQRLGVGEVWFFKKNNQFDIYRLKGNSYEKIETSQLLPDLDLTMLAEYAIAEDPLEAVLEFRDRIREQL